MSNFPSQNPYAPPQMPNVPQGPPPGSELVAPCYKCGCPYAKRITFTMWGGIVGPRMLNHVKCVRCFSTFNAKTGQSNNTAIFIYVGVCLTIAIILGIVAGVLPNLK
jgi:hypothetical protein